MTVMTEPMTSYEDYIKEIERRQAFKPEIGQIVKLHDDCATRTTKDVLYEVKSLPTGRSRYYVLDRVGGGQGLKAEPQHITPASEAEAARAKATPKAPRYVVGSVVVIGDEVAGRVRGYVKGTRLVVIAENKDGTLKVAVLGGDGGRYYPKLPAAMLKPVTL